MKNNHSTRLTALFLWLIFVPICTFAGEGGATSGGGDELGILAKRVLRQVSESIELVPNLYTAEQRVRVQKRFQSVESIIIVDEDLPAENSDHLFSKSFIQKGTAWSRFDGVRSQIKLNRKQYSEMADPIALEGLFMHELNVLAGIEHTGEYSYTDRYLEYREKFWNQRLTQKVICTVSLFSKGVQGQERVPGKLQGTVATETSSLGNAGAGLGILLDLEKKTKNNPITSSIVARYIIGGGGYFRLVLGKANTSNSASDTVLLSGPVSDLTPMITFYNPYDWASSEREAKLREFEFGFVQVACSRI